jgi:hypothetical protein
MLPCVALVGTDVSEEFSDSFIRVTRIGELGTTLAVTSNRRKLRINTKKEFVNFNVNGIRIVALQQMNKHNVIFLHPVARSITQSFSSVFVRHF